MREKYESLALADLKAIARTRGIRGTSVMKKAEVVEAMLALDEQEKKEAVPPADEETGKKKVLEKSWFTRGNKLIFIGIRKGDVWIPKKYKSSPYDAPIILIKNLNFDNGEYEVIEGRE